MKGSIVVQITNLDIQDADQIKTALTKALEPFIITQPKSSTVITVNMSQIVFTVPNQHAPT